MLIDFKQMDAVIKDAVAEVSETLIFNNIEEVFEGIKENAKKDVTERYGTDWDYLDVFGCVINNVIEYFKEKQKANGINLNEDLEDDGTEYGGISFEGERLIDFLMETNMEVMSTKEEINKALKECGIKEIKGF